MNAGPGRCRCPARHENVRTGRARSHGKAARSRTGLATSLPSPPRSPSNAPPSPREDRGLLHTQRCMARPARRTHGSGTTRIPGQHPSCHRGAARNAPTPWNSRKSLIRGIQTLPCAPAIALSRQLACSSVDCGPVQFVQWPGPSIRKKLRDVLRIEQVVVGRRLWEEGRRAHDSSVTRHPGAVRPAATSP
jgi:hypothetical protein